MQLIHDARAHLHQPMPMPQQSPQVPILCIAFALASCESPLHPRFTTRTATRSADAQTSGRAGFHPYTHPSCLERPVKLLGFIAVSQSPFGGLARVCVHKCNLLKARMIVTTYNQHVRLLSSEPFGWSAPPKFTRPWEPTLLWNHYTH